MKKEKNTNMWVGIVWNCPDMKLLLTTTLLFLLSASSLLHLLPLRPLSFFSTTCTTTTTTTSPTPPPLLDHPTIINNVTVLKRSFNTHGSASYLFIQMGAYRAGPNSFAVVGLGSKPLHVFSKPTFRCEWVGTHNGSSSSETVDGHKILPDWGYGRVYTVVVVNCSFNTSVGADSSGGSLIIHASDGSGSVERFPALVEPPGTVFDVGPPEFDFVYCGSPLYGNLSPQRVREWVAYHAKLFGERARVVVHDAGGVHREVMDVLKPWVELGLVTVQDVREQERFDGYYHNQFLIVNDCLHRYRFKAKWILFFDLDEYVYVPPKSTLRSVFAAMEDYAQFTIEQMPMSSKLCHSADAGRHVRKWGFEKLVYRDVKRGIRRDRKYAIQPRRAFATGVHMSQNVAGKTQHKTEGRIKYFHYHGTIANRREPCREFSNSTELAFEGSPYVFDDTLRSLAGSVKRFELKTIGPRLQRTRQ
ncbi:hypothetical protein QJS04_geneDACA014282 [Acorus gramineus]|uniref:Glycosyltransferase family 92 protein n=1 Tax=Acorus gramineus TaxID=55184 RepID=A0AAV9BZC7_ACOGR|nr:hypothetical protein QJS04_geneDACA014282 [Acorus gramineus]